MTNQYWTYFRFAEILYSPRKGYVFISSRCTNVGWASFPRPTCRRAGRRLLTRRQRRQSLSHCNRVAEWPTNCPIYLRARARGGSGRAACGSVAVIVVVLSLGGRPSFHPFFLHCTRLPACLPASLCLHGITRAIRAENTSFALQRMGNETKGSLKRTADRATHRPCPSVRPSVSGPHSTA